MGRLRGQRLRVGDRVRGVPADRDSARPVGPPLGGAAVGLFGPVTTVLADAVSYLLSARGIAAIGSHEANQENPAPFRLRIEDLLDGWRYILRSPALRPVFASQLLTGGLILAAEPPLAILMLRQLGFAPWQYTLAFGLPRAGALIGSRLAAPLADRFGRHRIMLVFGTLRACWPAGLAFAGRGAGGLTLVSAVQLGLMTCMGVFNPVYATYRLDHTAPQQVTRTLSA